MKLFSIAVILAAHLSLAVQPVRAASLDPASETSQMRRSTFAGARFRVPFGGQQAGKSRLGLALTSMQRADGASAARFSRGMEVGFAGRGKPQLFVAGQALGQQPSAKERKAGISTLGWIGIGTGVVLAAGVLWFIDAMGCDEDDECN